jgi:hypothetical protein
VGVRPRDGRGFRRLTRAPRLANDPVDALGAVWGGGLAGGKEVAVDRV